MIDEPAGTVVLVGNFGPPYSTENELRRALEAGCGRRVAAIQEDDRAGWEQATRMIAGGDVDAVVWVRTASLSARIPEATKRTLVDTARAEGVPVVGYHLDIWWGLAREADIERDPYFRLVDVLATADGGHDDRWADAGIEHWWYPPAVDRGQAELSLNVRRVHGPAVGFVGSWQGGYHAEWEHRHQLVAHLQRRGDCTFWPKPGEPAARGVDLLAIYGTQTVFVGDSCGGGPRYCSDRIPETLGRGGILIHPRTEGVTDGTLWREGEHLLCWTHGEWDELDHWIEWARRWPDEAAGVANAGRQHTLAEHTYDRRMADLLTRLQEWTA